MLMAGGRVRIWLEDRGLAGGSQLEYRSAGAGQDQVAGRERIAKRGLVLEQRVAGRSGGGFELCPGGGIVTAAGDVEHVIVARRDRAIGEERVESRQVDRAGTLASAEHQKAALLRVDSEPPTRRIPVGLEDRGGHWSPGHQKAIVLQPGNRKRQAHPSGP